MQNIDILGWKLRLETVREATRRWLMIESNVGVAWRVLEKKNCGLFGPTYLVSNFYIFLYIFSKNSTYRTFGCPHQAWNGSKLVWNIVRVKIWKRIEHQWIHYFVCFNTHCHCYSQTKLSNFEKYAYVLLEYITT